MGMCTADTRSTGLAFGGHMQDLMQISSIELAASLPEDLLHRLQAQSCAANSSF